MKKIRSKATLWDYFRQSDILPVLLVFVVLVVVVSLINVRFISWMNIKNVLVQVSINGILTLGMFMIILMGGIDLSVAQLVNLLGCGMAYLLHYQGWSVPQAVLFCVVLALAAEGFMGFIIASTRIEPFIISLGFVSIYQGATYLITNGSEIGIPGQFEALGRLFPLGENMPAMPVYIWLILTAVVWLVLKYSIFGKRIYAIGSNANAASLSGINVKRMKISVYMLNGLFTALGAMTLLSRLATGNPMMGTGKELDAIAAAVIGGTAMTGGKGNVWGVFIGVLLIGCISNSMNIIGVSPYWQYILRGIIIVGAVVMGYYSQLRAQKPARG